jgi:pseudaminic acid biosynthesis-associated methylase
MKKTNQEQFWMSKAYEVLKKNHDGFNGSVYEYKNKKRYDLTLSAGVLIHQNPKKLKSFYDQLYVNSKKYILICEYFNPKPVKVTYRGNENKLFKRDFAKELLNNYPKLKVIDYGFVWSNDKYAWGDDYNWFLFSK